MTRASTVAHLVGTVIDVEGAVVAGPPVEAGADERTRDVVTQSSVLARVCYTLVYVLCAVGSFVGGGVVWGTRKFEYVKE